MTNYQHAKGELKRSAHDAKREHGTDRPMVRQIINDTVDYLCKDMGLSDYERDLLSNYACKLHPKD